VLVAAQWLHSVQHDVLVVLLACDGAYFTVCPRPHSLCGLLATRIRTLRPVPCFSCQEFDFEEVLHFPYCLICAAAHSLHGIWQFETGAAAAAAYDEQPTLAVVQNLPG
jgi:hypothetical protein